jgi:putative endonuclease
VSGGIRQARSRESRLFGRAEVLGVEEFKRRTRLLAALERVPFDQRERVRRASLAPAGRPALGGAAVRLEPITLAPSRLPRHIADTWKANWGRAGA